MDMDTDQWALIYGTSDSPVYRRRQWGGPLGRGDSALTLEDVWTRFGALLNAQVPTPDTVTHVCVSMNIGSDRPTSIFWLP